MNEELALRDIHLPLDVGFWPPAPGWWLLALLSVLLGALGFYKYRHLLQQGRGVQPSITDVKTSALQELKRIEIHYADQPAEQLRALSALLRRITISLYGREHSAGLTGQDWLAFLSKRSGSPQFIGQFQKLLTIAPYRREIRPETSALIKAIRQWLNHADQAVDQRADQKHV